MTPGQFIKARIAAKLTPAQLGALLGVSERTVYRYEDGTRRVPTPIAKLMKMLADRTLQL